MRVVSTEVYVKGKTQPVKVYYLTEEGYAQFTEIDNLTKKMCYDLSACQSRINILQEENDILRTILREPLVEHFKTEYAKALEQRDSATSFRWHEIQLRNVPYRFAEEKSEAFARLVKDGYIVERGSGWYRINRET